MASTVGSSLDIMIKSREDDKEEWDFFHSFMLCLAIYVLVLGLTLIIVFLIVKYLGDYGTQITAASASETNLLIQNDSVSTSVEYGTYEEEEVAAGDIEERSSPVSSEELYDGKICAICYERQRDCLFAPCGHRATCSVCAQRIIDGESKSCPLCRTLIRKLRILL